MEKKSVLIISQSLVNALLSKPPNNNVIEINSRHSVKSVDPLQIEAEKITNGYMNSFLEEKQKPRKRRK